MLTGSFGRGLGCGLLTNPWTAHARHWHFANGQNSCVLLAFSNFLAVPNRRAIH